MADMNKQKNGAEGMREKADENAAHENPESKKNSPLDETLEKKVAEYENDLKRLQAEFENYKKRAEKEKSGAREAGKAEAVRHFVALYDELGHACAHAKNSSKDDIANGISLLYKKMGESLSSMGVKEVSASGEIDPHMHEVLMREEGGKEGHVAKVLRKGWRLGDNLVRPAQVSVYSGKKEEEKSDADEAENSQGKTDGNEKKGSGADAQE